MNTKLLQGEIDVARKVIDKKLHYAKNTLKAMINLFDGLANTEDQYVKGLKATLHASSIQGNIKECKENEMSVVKQLIDVMLSSHIQMADHHLALRDHMKNVVKKGLTDLLNNIRNLKKNCLKDIDGDLRRDINQFNERYKKNLDGIYQLEKKLSNASKKQNENEIASYSMRLKEARQHFENEKVVFDTKEETGKQALANVIGRVQSIEFYRVEQMKDILSEHMRVYSDIKKKDYETSDQVKNVFDKTNIELDLEDYENAKKFIFYGPNAPDINTRDRGVTAPIDYKKSHSEPVHTSSQNAENTGFNSRSDTQNTQQTERSKSPQNRLKSSTTSERRVAQRPKNKSRSRSPMNSDLSPNSSTDRSQFNSNRSMQSQFARENEDQKKKQKYEQLKADREKMQQDMEKKMKQKQDQQQNQLPLTTQQKGQLENQYFEERVSSRFNTQAALYVRDPSQEFNYSRSIFLEGSPHHEDVLTKFDIKYYNAVMYAFLSYHIQLDTFGQDPSGGPEQRALMRFKNKIKLNLRETKLTNMIFKVKMKNKVDYKNDKMKEMTFLESFLGNMSRFLQKKKEKILTKLAKPEDFSFFIKLVKHLFVLLGQNRLWQNDSGFKLRMTVSPHDAFIFKDYDQIAQFFFEPIPESAEDYDFISSVVPIMENKIITRPRNKISFPLNMQICESIMSTLVDNKDEKKLLVDDWEENLDVYTKFCSQCLGLEDEITLLILIKNIFEKNIKPNLIVANKAVIEYLAEVSPLVQRLTKLIQTREMIEQEQDMDIHDPTLKEKFSQEVDNVQQQINDYVKFTLSKEMWMGSIKLFENMKRHVPPEKHSVEAILQFTYCAFKYQKPYLKIPDFVSSANSALAVCGFNVAKGYEIKLRKNLKDKKGFKKQSKEFLSILESLEKEIKYFMEGHIRYFMLGLSRILQKAPTSFEERLKLSFIKGLMNSFANDLKTALSHEGDNEVEEAITIIANNLSKVDSLIQAYGLPNVNYTDICAVALEKWVIGLDQRSRQVSREIVLQENWEVPPEGEPLHTSSPLDLCYMMFNPVEIFKTMVEGEFKDRMVRRFEMVVFETLSTYFDYLDGSLATELKNVPKIEFKKFASPSKKKKLQGKIPQELFAELETKEHMDMMTKNIKRYMLRLGNLKFMEEQIKETSSSIFGGGNQSLLASLSDFIATYGKRICKKIAKLVSGIWFKRHFFQFLYTNFDEQALNTTLAGMFQESYEYSGTNLIGLLVPIMKLLKKLTPEIFFDRLLVELVEPFLQEWVQKIIDPDIAPRSAHDKYRIFLQDELDTFQEFFFPPNSSYVVEGKITNKDVSQKFEDAERVVRYFKLSSHELVEEFKAKDPLSDSDYLALRVIPRILVLREDTDQVAKQFRKNFKKVIR